MKKYIVKRLLQLIPILIGITLLTFVLMNASSTDAVDVMEQNTGTSWTEEQKKRFEQNLVWITVAGTVSCMAWQYPERRYGRIVYFRTTGIFTVCIKTSGNHISDDYFRVINSGVVDSVGHFVGGAKK